MQKIRVTTVIEESFDEDCKTKIEKAFSDYPGKFDELMATKCARVSFPKLREDHDAFVDFVLVDDNAESKSQ